jgi:hypothetical protein
MKRLIWVVPLLLTAGCAPEYAYVPEQNATATVRGRVAADYPIPPGAPRGDVRIASYGIAEVSSEGSPGETVRALHLRMVLENNSAAAWTLDTREQRVQLDGADTIAAAFASANAGVPPPMVTVPPSGKRVVDLFFALPAALQDAEAIPEFDAMWRVNAGPAGVIAERTPFERLTIEPDEGSYDSWDYGPDYYWGGPYWINGDLPYAGYGGPGFSRGGVSIHRSAHFSHGRGGRGGGRGFHGEGGRGGGGGHGGGGHGGGGGHR